MKYVLCVFAGALMLFAALLFFGCIAYVKKTVQDAAQKFQDMEEQFKTLTTDVVWLSQNIGDREKLEKEKLEWQYQKQIQSLQLQLAQTQYNTETNAEQEEKDV